METLSDLIPADFLRRTHRPLNNIFFNIHSPVASSHFVPGCNEFLCYRPRLGSSGELLGGMRQALSSLMHEASTLLPESPKESSCEAANVTTVAVEKLLLASRCGGQQ